ncbi:hypothetical protein HOY82DRAFT_577202 [Tuber indicum]|nr:hypothetical protein HOY82DRAFT_577202 [Tuber indicum]
MAWQIRLHHGSTDFIRPTEAHICLRKPTRDTNLWIPFSESIPNGATGFSRRRSYHALIYSSWNPHS